MRSTICKWAACAVLVTGVSAMAQIRHSDDQLPKEPAKKLSELDQHRLRVQAAYEADRGTDGLDTRVIYGADDRRDTYELGGGEAVIQSLQQGVCVVVSTSEVTDNGNGTYTLSTVPWTSTFLGGLCTSEPFYGQDTIGFCSGFLVGTDLIATAGHCVDSGNCGSVAFVFGFDQQSASQGPDTIVSADDVYFCTGIIDQAQVGNLDHCVLQVDRAVNRQPLPIRRTGSVANGDPLVMIGHPATLPKKTDDGAVVQNANGSVEFFEANLDAYGGNSGSMVANLNTGVVEGILVRGNTDYTSSGGCVVSNQCADTGCPGWEDCSKTTAFATSVPELGLQTLPAGNTTHIGVVGGPFTNDPTVYTLSNPTGSDLDYTVSIVGGGTAPILLDGGTAAVNGTITAGGNASVTVSLDPNTAGLAAGIYATDLLFDDTTNGLSVNRKHIVEIGTTGFDVDPVTELITGGPVGGPFSGSIAYTVTSNRPTPVDVDVVVSDGWIATSTGSFTLSGTGTSQMVTISIDASASGLAAGLYMGTVGFQNASGGEGLTSRDVTLDVGRFTYAATDTPVAINDNSTSTSTITVGDSFCIGDVNVEMNISHTFIGDLEVDLTSPEGTTVRLHDRTGSSSDDIITTYDEEGGTLPDGPGLLTDFIGEIPTGVWTLTITDNAGLDTGQLNAWSLKIAAAGTVCPPTAGDLDVETPVNTPIDIDLAGASGTGSFDTIITSLPASGSLSDPGAGLINSVPYTLAAGGEIVRYTPPAGYTGPASFTYKVNDGQDSNTATVNVTVGVAVPVYSFPMDSDPNWTTEGQWAFGVPAGIDGDPTAGATGSNVYGYNLNGEYANNIPEYSLTTGALDLSGVFNVELRFQRWLGVESATFDHARVDVSNDGTTWVNVWDHTQTSALNETSWSLQTYDISATADDQATVYIRWVMGTTDGSVTYHGWNIDDVEVLGLVSSACPGDTDGSGTVDLNDLATVLANFGASGATLAQGDLDGDGNVGLSDLAIVLANFGVSC